MTNRWVFLSFALLLFTSCEKKVEKKQLPPVSVTATKAFAKDVFLYEETVGHINGLNIVAIQSQVTGVLTAAYFDEGKAIKKGDLMLTVDDRSYRADLEKAQAELDQALAQLKYAQDNTRRNTPLVQDEYISEDTYENLLTTVLVDEGLVKEKQAAVDLAKVNLGYCYIYAPMDAVAGNRNIDPGNLLTAEATETIVTLEQIKPINCIIYISELLLPQLQTIKRERTIPVIASFDKDFKDTREGMVSFIDNTVNPSTGMIKIKGRFQNLDEYLWPGEYINVRIILGELKDAVLLPAQAIQNSIKGKYVYVIKKDDTVERRDLTLGQREDDDMIILSGLEAGEIVVLEGQFNLENGSKVSIKSESDIKQVIKK